MIERKRKIKNRLRKIIFLRGILQRIKSSPWPSRSEGIQILRKRDQREREREDVPVVVDGERRPAVSM
jgi:hypothetical protein